MSALRRWLVEGTAQRWLTGAAVLFCLAMVVGLVVVVVEVSAGFFWARPLGELRLADGSRVLGEEWGREPDPAVDGSERVRMRTGNREISGLDFRWIRGVDVASKAQIYEAVAGAAAAGKAVLMVSSYLPELLGVCDRLAVMSRGRLGPAREVAEWTPASVLEAAIGA